MNILIKEVPDTNGRYFASSYGHIISVMPNGRIKEMKEYTAKGYKYIHACVNNKPMCVQVHRFVARAFIGECPKDFTVNHKNEIRSDNRPENLEYLSRGDNVRYSLKNRPNIRLAKEVLSIDVLTGEEVLYSSVANAARTLGISGGHIADCCRGTIKSYKGKHWMYV